MTQGPIWQSLVDGNFQHLAHKVSFSGNYQNSSVLNLPLLVGAESFGRVPHMMIGAHRTSFGKVEVLGVGVVGACGRCSPLHPKQGCMHSTRVSKHFTQACVGSQHAWHGGLW